MIRRLAHLCLLTDRLPELVRFYETLGLKVHFRFVNPVGVSFGVYLQCGDSTFIEILDHTVSAEVWGGEATPLRGGGRYGHACLEVTGLVDFRHELIARGVPVSEIRSGSDGSAQAWTADPDGNRIELMEYTVRSWQLRPPTLDRLSS